ncbi:MAG: hypothetical protein ACK58T_49550, partial [Phycisphaerae bacterium]
SMASASRSFATICSGVCLVRFIESLLAATGGSRDSHSCWIRIRGAGHDHAAICHDDPLLGASGRA